MGHVVHHAIIATTFDADLADSLYEFCILSGAHPTTTSSKVNRYYTVFIGPDGSKSGWPDSDEGDRIRAAIKNKIASFNYEDGSNPFEWVEVSYSSDDERAAVTDSRWPIPKADPAAVVGGSGPASCSTAAEIAK